MPDNLTIPKTTSSFQPYLDFNKLREAGIRHIENLGSDLWTDYNIHDPGITILEVLCYALTDLGYRTHFDIKDLLARSQEQKSLEHKNIFGQLTDDNFFTAAEILTSNPVTIRDFRKLLLDIPGVRSAWLQKAPEGELPIFLDKDSKRLVSGQPPNPDEDCKLCLRGLYDVCIETEPLLKTDACGSVFFSENDILREVYQMLNAHRNLCEDVRDVIVFGKEQITICADIELAAFADKEDVLLEIYKQVEEFLSPTVRFFTLQEMLEKGRPMEEIFEGRPLSARSHGFIEPADLDKQVPRSELHASDLYRVIMDVKGVLAVRNLSMANSIDGVPLTSGEEWCLPLTPKYRPHFDLGRSRIVFFKGLLPFNADKKAVQQRYKEEKAAAMKTYLDPYQLDRAVPDGNHRNLEDYTSIMEEFPLTYGTGSAGIKSLPTAQRHGQAKQLKAYLLFFDQLLANYLAQLAHLRDLFSLRPDDHPTREGSARTYFTQLLKDVPGIKELVLNYGKCAANGEDPPPPEDYPSYLDYIVESIENYHERRGRFLDHLLARFGESFSDYVLLMFEVNGKRHDNARIIRDKARFLKRYPEISRNRGKGFDYSKPTEWCGKELGLTDAASTNVSGLEMRISKVLGFADAGRNKLAFAGTEEQPAGWGWAINLGGEEALRSKQRWPNQEDACAALEEIQTLLGSQNAYRRLTYYRTDRNPQFGFCLNDHTGAALALGPQRFSSAEERDNAILRIISRVKLPGIQVSAIQQTECFSFELYDYTGSELLLQSLHGFATLEAAMAFFDTPDSDDDFVGWAVDRDNYQIVEKDGRFSFVLLDGEGAVVATHPHYYDSEEACEDRIQAIIYYLDGLPPNTQVVEEMPGDYSFKITDDKGTTIWESVLSYPVEDDMQKAIGLVRALSRHRIYYRLLNDLDGDLKFGFELLDRHGDLIASHPHKYATDCERDLALDAVLFGSQNLAPKQRIFEHDGSFHFELLNPDGKLLVRSLSGYPDEGAAETAWNEFLQLAVWETNYHDTDTGAGATPFGFEIRDAGGTAIAAYVTHYATAAERNMARRALLNLLCHIQWHVEAAGTPGIYHFSVVGENGRILLGSIQTYPSGMAAKVALKAVLEAARYTENFHPLPGFGFELRDADGLLLASHPQTYADEEQRDAAIFLIVNYVRDDAPRIDIRNTGGAFYAVIYDQHGNTLFKGTQLHPNWEGAQADLEDLLGLAALPESYQVGSNGDAPCSFGFSLVNADGETVARHIAHYASAIERDTAMQDVFAMLTHGEALSGVEGTTCGYYFTLSHVCLDENGEPENTVLLIGTQHFPSAADSLQALLAYSDTILDTEVFRPEQMGDEWHLVWRNEVGEIIASGDRSYMDEDTAMADRDCMLSALTGTTGLTCDNEEEVAVFFEERSFFCRLASGGVTWLESAVKVPVQVTWPVNHTFHSKSARELAIRETIAFFKAVDSFKPDLDISEDEHGKFSYGVNVNGLRFEGPVAYDDLDSAREAYGLLFKTGRERSNYRLIDEENCTHSFELLDGKALAQACDHCRTMHERGQNSAHFNLIEHEDACLHGLELADEIGLPIAFHPTLYSTAEARNQAISELAAQLNTEGLHLIEHILLRPRRMGLDTLYEFELRDNERSLALFKSAVQYASKAEAWAALANAFASIWKYKNGDAEYIRLTEDPDDSCRFSYEIMAPDETGELFVIALPPGACQDAGHRQEMIDRIKDLVTEEPNGIPVLPDTFLARINSLRLSEEIIGDALLPPVCGCGENDCDTCTCKSDPYSFRATVVLPYWPERFLQPEFRAFVETTLRREAPAHIFLRICWVDPCQMAAFENAYCRWVATKAGGDQGCDASIALNNLIDIVTRLRNIYPVASLHDCEEPAANANRVILNYSIIGSAR